MVHLCIILLVIWAVCSAVAGILLGRAFRSMDLAQGVGSSKGYKGRQNVLFGPGKASSQSVR